jgi:hypothetical protein
MADAYTEEQKEVRESGVPKYQLNQVLEDVAKGMSQSDANNVLAEFVNSYRDLGTSPTAAGGNYGVTWLVEFIAENNLPEGNPISAFLLDPAQVDFTEVALRMSEIGTRSRVEGRHGQSAYETDTRKTITSDDVAEMLAKGLMLDAYDLLRGGVLKLDQSGQPGVFWAKRTSVEKATIDPTEEELDDAWEADGQTNAELFPDGVPLPTRDPYRTFVRGGEYDEDAAATLARGVYQCFLLHNLTSFAEYHRNRRIMENKQGPYFARDTGAPRVLLVDETRTENTLSAINKMTLLGKTDHTDDITVAEIAQLVPKLRIYKVYRSYGKEKAKVEMKFDNKTDMSRLSTTLAGEELKAFGMPFSKGSGVGIKSFNWSFLGNNQFTATRDLKATLKIFFQDFRDLTEIREDSTNLYDAPSNDSENPSKPFPYRYLDLVLQPDCTKKLKEPKNIEDETGSDTGNYDVMNPDCYECAIEVGYGDVSKSNLRQAIKDMISQQTTTFFLSPTSHTFDIKQDGTFELTIEYRARIASLLGDKGMNVMLPGGGHALSGHYTNIGGFTWDMNKLQELIDEERERIGEDSSREGDTLWKLKRMREAVVEQSRLSLYQGIYKTLYEHKLIHYSKISRRDFNRFSHFAKFDRSAGVPLNIDTWRADSEEAKAMSGHYDYAKPRTPAWLIYSDTYSRRIGDRSTDTLAARVSRKSDHSIQFTYLGDLLGVVFEHVAGEEPILLGGQVGGVRTPYGVRNQTEQELKENLYKWAESIRAEGSDGKILSGEDFIDKLDIKRGGSRVSPSTYEMRGGRDFGGGPTTLTGAQADRLKHFKIILGSFGYKDYIDEEFKILNMAHFPISMDYFSDFFYERAVRSKRTNWSLQDFCIDVLNDIILKNLSHECFGGYFKNDAKASISLLGAQGTQELGQTYPRDPLLSFWSKKSNYDYKDLKLHWAKPENPIFFVQTKSNRAKNYHYMMFTISSVRAFNQRLDGTVDGDRNKGIPHFQFGATTGLLKSANFTKTPLQYHAEQRWAEEGSDNMLNQLAGIYEMQLNMVGNNLFIPGQYIYFNPVAMGIGPPNYRTRQTRSFANRMGLGGYHLITEVAGTITPGKFETSIKSIWETAGKNAGS